MRTGRSTLLWQYGESVDRDNYADIDQINPRTAGLLAPRRRRHRGAALAVTSNRPNRQVPSLRSVV